MLNPCSPRRTTKKSSASAITKCPQAIGNNGGEKPQDKLQSVRASVDDDDPLIAPPRTSKADIHAAIIQDVIDWLPGTPERPHMRLFTLPGLAWCFETALLNPDEGIGSRIEEVIGIDSFPDFQPTMRSNVRRLSQFAPKASVRAVPCAPSDAFLTSDNFKKGRRFMERNIRLDQGFDLIWLDWMSGLTEEPCRCLVHLCENINIFERAWKKQRPGLLYINLALDQADSADFDTMSFAFRYSEDDDGNKKRSVELEKFELESIINRLINSNKVRCKTTRIIRYEDPIRSWDMVFAGFEITPSYL